MNKVEYVAYYFKFKANTLACMTPQKVFKPKGLLLWDESVDNMVERICIRIEDQLMETIPCRFFLSPYSPEDLQVLAKHGYIQSTLRDKGCIELTLPTVYIPDQITITTSKPISEFCIWGIQHADD